MSWWDIKNISGNIKNIKDQIVNIADLNSESYNSDLSCPDCKSIILKMTSDIESLQKKIKQLIQERQGMILEHDNSISKIKKSMQHQVTSQSNNLSLEHKRDLASYHSILKKLKEFKDSSSYEEANKIFVNTCENLDIIQEYQEKIYKPSLNAVQQDHLKKINILKGLLTEADYFLSVLQVKCSEESIDGQILSLNNNQIDKLMQLLVKYLDKYNLPKFQILNYSDPVYSVEKCLLILQEHNQLYNNDKQEKYQENIEKCKIELQVQNENYSAFLKKEFQEEKALLVDIYENKIQFFHEEKKRFESQLLKMEKFNDDEITNVKSQNNELIDEIKILKELNQRKISDFEDIIHKQNNTISSLSQSINNYKNTDKNTRETLVTTQCRLNEQSNKTKELYSVLDSIKLEYNYNLEKLENEYKKNEQIMKLELEQTNKSIEEKFKQKFNESEMALLQEIKELKNKNFELGLELKTINNSKVGINQKQDSTVIMMKLIKNIVIKYQQADEKNKPVILKSFYKLLGIEMEDPDTKEAKKGYLSSIPVLNRFIGNNIPNTAEPVKLDDSIGNLLIKYLDENSKDSQIDFESLTENDIEDTLSKLNLNSSLDNVTSEHNISFIKDSESLIKDSKLSEIIGKENLDNF